MKQNKISFAVTNSERTRFSCQHKWFLTVGLGIDPQESSPALDFGNIWHNSMEALYEGWNLVAAHRSIDETCDELLQNVTVKTGGLFEVPVGLSTYKSEKIEAHREMAHEKLDLYFDTYSHVGSSMPYKSAAHDSLIMNETVMCEPVGGNYYAGMIDKLVTIGDKVWIIEHKTSTIEPDTWIKEHEYGPQALTYASLIYLNKGIYIDGVIFDYVMRKSPKPSSAYKAIASGKRLSKPKGLPFTTAENWLEAINSNGFCLSDEDYYSDIYSKLLARERNGFWFRRIPIPFTQEEIERSIKEMTVISHEITKRKRWLWEDQQTNKQLKDAHYISEGEWRNLASDLARKHGHLFPRNSGECWKYRRACPVMDMCRHQQPESIHNMVPREHVHPELAEREVKQ